MEKETSINKLYREKLYIQMTKNRPLSKPQLRAAEEEMQNIMKEKTGSVKYEKIFNGVLHYFETVKTSPEQAVELLVTFFKNDDKLLINALYSIYTKEQKSMAWFFETSLQILRLYEENIEQFKNIIRQNLVTNVTEFIKKIETSYEVMNLFEAQVPGIKNYFIKEVVINSFEARQVLRLSRHRCP
jgi:hypothetical protein